MLGAYTGNRWPMTGARHSGPRRGGPTHPRHFQHPPRGPPILGPPIGRSPRTPDKHGRTNMTSDIEASGHRQTGTSPISARPQPLPISKISSRPTLHLRAVPASVLLTHLGSDHTIGIQTVLLMSWAYGREVPLEAHGPVGTRSLMEIPAESYRRNLRERRFGSEAKERKSLQDKTIPNQIEDKGVKHEN